jgi:Putative Ig domain
MLRTCGFVVAMAVLLAACGGGDSGGVSSTAAPPLELHIEYGLGPGSVGVPYGPYPPAGNGTVTGYAVSPALPAGLTLDPTTGVISGTPSAAAPETTYTITASNTYGSAKTSVTFAVLAAPNVSYASPVTATLGAPLTPLIPTVGGAADYFAIEPALPDGLQIDSATGVVSGTPSRVRIAVSYTIFATNDGGGYTTADLLLSVDPGPAGTAVTGVLRGATVVGLAFVSGAHTGQTDKSGGYTYEVGQGISFSVGAVSIGTVPMAKPLITPVDLVAHGTGASNRVLNVVRFLMMLDQDGNPNNGIQISAAVTAAAATWAPVDFDTTDLSATLGPLIQLASAADGSSHVLPDAATAQAQLRTGFYCNVAGNYQGTFAADSNPGWYGAFVASVSPDGSMHSTANSYGALNGFDAQTNDALNPALDGTFAQSAVSPTVDLQGSLSDAVVLKGIYLADVAGSFQAIADGSVAAIYKFSGSYTSTPTGSTSGTPSSGPVYFGMDDSNQVSGSIQYGLEGTVTGNTFTGTMGYRPDPYSPRRVTFPVSGTYSNSAAGISLDGQYSTGDSVVTFATTGCRAN